MTLPVIAIEGDVISAHSYWAGDGSRIVTEAILQTRDGQKVVVSQLGGSVDGIGMITMPGPVLLEPGMRVAVAAHNDIDLARRQHVVLDGVKVLAYPAGYVRLGPTRAGHSLHWDSSCVLVTMDSSGTTAIADDREFPVIDASIATWNKDTATSSCSYLDLVSEGRKLLEVGRDNINLIKFRDTMWGRPAIGNDPPRMYSPSAAGITTVAYVDDGSERDGALLDADIELNGVDFAISVNGETNSKAACRVELQNNLTHELGHLLGLEHTCLAGGDPPRRDNLGNQVPLCAITSDPKIIDATMYNFQDCGEIKKETLSDDDVLAMCDFYPVANDPGSCAREDPVGGDGPIGGDGSGESNGAGCCSASGSERPGTSLLLAATVVLTVIRPRRRFAAADESAA